MNQFFLIFRFHQILANSQPGSVKSLEKDLSLPPLNIANVWKIKTLQVEIVNFERTIQQNYFFV